MDFVKKSLLCEVCPLVLWTLQYGPSSLPVVYIFEDFFKGPISYVSRVVDFVKRSSIYLVCQCQFFLYKNIKMMNITTCLVIKVGGIE